MLVHRHSKTMTEMRKTTKWNTGILYLFSGAVPSSVKELSGMSRADLRKQCVFSREARVVQHPDDPNASYIEDLGEGHGFKANEKFVSYNERIMPMHDMFLMGVNNSYRSRYNMMRGLHTNFLFANNFDKQDLRFMKRTRQEDSTLRSFPNISHRTGQYCVHFDIGQEVAIEEIYVKTAIGGSWNCYIQYGDPIATTYEQEDDTFDVYQMSKGEMVRIKDPDNMPIELKEAAEAASIIVKWGQVITLNNDTHTSWNWTNYPSCFVWRTAGGSARCTNHVHSTLPVNNASYTNFIASGKRTRVFRKIISIVSDYNVQSMHLCLNYKVAEEDMPPKDTSSENITWAVFSYDGLSVSDSQAHVSKDHPIMLFDVAEPSNDNNHGIVLEKALGITEDNYREFNILESSFTFPWTES